MITYYETGNEKFYYDPIEHQWFVWYFKENHKQRLTIEGREEAYKAF